MIILDFGNGSVCLNDRDNIKTMIDRLADVDIDRKIVIKWQLFLNIPPKLSLRRDLFDFAYKYAADLGFMTTASVFDLDSLDFLLRYHVPFVKLANQPQMWRYTDDVPRSVDLYVSVGSERDFKWMWYKKPTGVMACVSEYPATIDDYYETFGEKILKAGISDHTDNISLYKAYRPRLYEKHYTVPEIPTDKVRKYCADPYQVKKLLEVKNEHCNDADSLGQ